MTAAQRILAEDTLRWIRICRREGYCVDKDDGLPTDADLWHSSLLGRLIDGKEPLSAPPPLLNSYPCYALAEGDAVTVRDGYERPKLAPECLLLGGALWRIIERVRPDEWIVANRGLWWVKRHGPDALKPLGLKYEWRIERAQKGDLDKLSPAGRADRATLAGATE